MGGVWKLAEEREATLRETAHLLQEELRGVRALLLTSDESNRHKDCLIDSLEYELSCMKKSEDAMKKAVASEHENLGNLSFMLKEALTKVDELQVEMRDLNTGLLESDWRLKESMEKGDTLLRKMTLYKQDCTTLQTQYDFMESRAEDATKLAEREKNRAKTLARLNDQKENGLRLLASERDRGLEEIAVLKLELSKLKTCKAQTNENELTNSISLQSAASKEISKFSKVGRKINLFLQYNVFCVVACAFENQRKTWQGSSFEKSCRGEGRFKM